MSAELDTMNKHLESLDLFLKSPAFDGYKRAVAHDIAQTEQAVLMFEPVDRASEIEGFKLRGELRCLQQRVNTFEEARVTLKKRIDDLAEREMQNATNTKQ